MIKNYNFTKLILLSFLFSNTFSMEEAGGPELDNPFNGDPQKAAEHVASGKPVETWMINYSIFHQNLPVLRALTSSNNIPLDRYEGGLAHTTPLHDAADSNAADIIHYLIREKGVNPNLLDSDNETPLHAAMQGFHHEALKALLQYQINIDAKNRSGRTAMQLAASANDYIAIGLLQQFKSRIEQGKH